MKIIKMRQNETKFGVLLYCEKIHRNDNPFKSLS